MSKNSKKIKPIPDNNNKTAPVLMEAEGAESVDSPWNTSPSVDTAPGRLELKTQIGGIDTELYDRLIQPAMMSFSLRRDDEPLRQLIESIVTAIVMRDAYDGYRKLDDISQRYLYYCESVDGISRRTRESVELGALCDYWRSQAMMMLIRDSAAIFELLLPDVHVPVPETQILKQIMH